PVWIVLDPLDGRRLVAAGALEVDLAIGLLVTTAAETRGDVAVIITPAGGVLTLHQCLYRLSVVQPGPIDADQRPLAWRDGLVGSECHDGRTPPLQTRGHVDGVTFLESHNGAFGRLQLCGLALEILQLALAHQRVDTLDLDVE